MTKCQRNTIRAPCAKYYPGRNDALHPTIAP